MSKVIGLKLAKREPFISAKGEMIDDGVNREIVLCSSDNEQVVDYFLKSLKSRIHGKSWKIYKK